MHHKTRIILFYTFVALFLLLGAGVLAYSYGWRIDFETGKIQKIGAIYVKANVRDITITINDKVYNDESGILQSGTLISNLLPKAYRIAITKDGYLPFHKTLTVQPARVEELLNVQLIPTTFESTLVAPTKGAQFVDVTEGAERFITHDQTKNIYYVHEKMHASSTINLTMATANAKRGQKIKRVAFVPFKSTQFVIEDATGLKLFDSEKRTVETLMTGSIITWTMQDSTIVGVETDPKSRTQKVFTFNLIFKKKAVLDDVTAQLPKTAYLTSLDTTNDLRTIALLTVESNLLLFTPEDSELRRIADNVRSFAFSPDNKKLLILSNAGSASVLFIDDFDGDIQKKAGDVIALSLPNLASVKTLTWYADSYHILVERPSELLITELDDRKPLNIFPLIDGFTDYHYDPKDKSIYAITPQGITATRIER